MGRMTPSFLEYLFRSRGINVSVVDCATKMVNYYIKNTCISRDIGAVFLTLGSRKNHERNKMTPVGLMP